MSNVVQAGGSVMNSLNNLSVEQVVWLHVFLQEMLQEGQTPENAANVAHVAVVRFNEEFKE